MGGALSLGVVIPARDAAATLAETLASVGAQLRPPDEVVVVDDGSTDATAAIGRAWGATVVSSGGVGIAGARNAGMAELFSDYVALLDADDAWPRGYLASAAARLSQEPATLLCAGHCEVTPQGRFVGFVPPPTPDLTVPDVLVGTPILPSATVMDRAAALDAGGFNEWFQRCEDLEMFTRLIAAGVTIAVNPCPVRYAIRADREPVGKLDELADERRRLLWSLYRDDLVTERQARTVRRHWTQQLARRYEGHLHRRHALRCHHEHGWTPQGVAHAAFTMLPTPARLAARRATRALRHARARRSIAYREATRWLDDHLPPSPISTARPAASPTFQTTPDTYSSEAGRAIVHVIVGLDVGGAERLLAHVAGAQRRAGHRVLVVALRPHGPVADQLASAHVPVTTLDVAHPAQMPAAWTRLWRLLRATRPDVLHAWMPHANLIGGAAAVAARVPAVVWSLHGSTFNPANLPRRTRAVLAANRRLAHRVPDRVICTSHAAQRDALADSYPGARLRVVRNAVPLGRVDEDGARKVRADLGIPSEAPLVGLIARHASQKDQPTFLRAVVRLLAERADVHVVACGAGVTPDNPDLATLVPEDPALARRLHLLGRYADPTPVQAALDVAVSSSAFGESLPLAVIEAMGQATPTVVTDVGDCAAVVGDTGEVVPPRDPEALGAAIGRLVALPPEQRRDLGVRARQRALAHFDLGRLLADYDVVYDEALADPRARGGAACGR